MCSSAPDTATDFTKVTAQNDTGVAELLCLFSILGYKILNNILEGMSLDFIFIRSTESKLYSN